jgi:hypothetical protein
VAVLVQILCHAWTDDAGRRIVYGSQLSNGCPPRHGIVVPRRASQGVRRRRGHEEDDGVVRSAHTVRVLQERLTVEFPKSASNPEAARSGGRQEIVTTRAWAMRESGITLRRG